MRQIFPADKKLYKSKQKFSFILINKRDFLQRRLKISIFYFDE